jgi:hypothetical protein
LTSLEEIFRDLLEQMAILEDEAEALRVEAGE